MMMLSWTRTRLLSSAGQVCSSSGALLSQKREDLLSSACERSSLRLQQQRGNCNRAVLGNIRREKYLRVYPVRLVRPDGSSITIRMKEPRRLAYLPVDLTTLNEQEMRERLAARKPQMLISKTDEHFDDNFDPDEYSFMWSGSKSASGSEQQQSSNVTGKATEANKSKETTGKVVDAKSKEAGKAAKTKSKEVAKGAEGKSKSKKTGKEVEANSKEIRKDVEPQPTEAKKRPEVNVAEVETNEISDDKMPKKMTG